MTLVICQKSSNPTPTGWVRSGGASTRSHGSEAGARAILALGALGLENKSRVRGCAHRNRMRPISARGPGRDNPAPWARIINAWDTTDSYAMRPVNVCQEAGESYATEHDRILHLGARSSCPNGRRANPTAWDPTNPVLWGPTLLPHSRRANPTAWEDAQILRHGTRITLRHWRPLFSREAL